MRGRCLCGEVRYQAEFRPEAVYYCHCSQCRRASGSSFATNVAVLRKKFSILEGKDWIKYYTSSPGKRRNFCSKCGSPLYSEYLEEPETIYLRVGTLVDDGSLRAVAHIYVDSKASWYNIDDGLPQHGGEADVRKFPPAQADLDDRDRR